MSADPSPRPDLRSQAEHGDITLVVELIEGLRSEFGGQLDGISSTLTGVLTEARKTNGRVTKLERDRDVAIALAQERAHVATITAQTLAEAETRQVRREDYRRIHLPSLLIGLVPCAIALVAVIHP